MTIKRETAEVYADSGQTAKAWVYGPVRRDPSGVRIEAIGQVCDVTDETLTVRAIGEPDRVIPLADIESLAPYYH